MRKLSSDSEVIVEDRMAQDDGGERGPEPVEPPGPDELPRLASLREKVEYMVEKTFPGQRVSGRVFAELVRDRGGSLSHSYFSNILAGKVTQPSEDILKALGLGFGVDWRFFKEESEVVDDVVAGLQFLAKRRTGEISGLAGRGIDEDGLPPELLQFALDLLEDAARDRAGGDDGGGAGGDGSGGGGGGAGGGGGGDSAVNPRSAGPAA
ncbi:hypothetical protein [Streptomyces sp. SP18CM02]|uniref:hypothetical protein n=1 Tax=Streptomyces sp. SP18CM02 TaxID=2758571 RepID=UPI00168AA381|nr:hypothetical protein [Streptomyces sp. SP18CM02]MBD3554383.1 hypothetical protein [Streptomyces sp. SP18CM02]